MKFIELFAGIGGFRYGLENLPPKRVEGFDPPVWENAFKCVYANEFNKYAAQIYKERFKDEIDTRDIREVRAEEIPDHDLLTAGFPCQSFSIAGKRGGFDDTRGTLFFEIARILKVKKPRLFLLENVKGLLSHDSGNTFKTIITTLTELGYDLQWQVLNSKNFGVPQNRERVFIVGHIRGQPRPEVFPITASSEQTNELQGLQVGAITARRGTAKSDGDYVVESNRKAQEIKVVGTLETDGWEKRHEQIRRVHGIDGISPTIPTGTGGGVMTKVAIPVLTPDRPVKRQNGRRFKEDGEPSFTLTGQDKHGVSDGMRIRRLTPTECERLQGFPDGWTEGISDTQRYKVLGNAVSTPVITAIGQRLMEIGNAVTTNVITAIGERLEEVKH